jgi:hypothetical protein
MVLTCLQSLGVPPFFLIIASRCIFKIEAFILVYYFINLEKSKRGNIFKGIYCKQRTIGKQWRVQLVAGPYRLDIKVRLGLG